MNRLEKINFIRRKLESGEASIGSWMQIPDASVAEIMGRGGYDWIAVDMEHGSIAVHQLPNLFRSLELGGTLPMARLAKGSSKDCKQALDAGAGGVIIPMIETAEQLEENVQFCCWPPKGKRGVGFSRANLFGENFNEYFTEAQHPLIVAQIESIKAVDNLDSICKISGLDALIVGPYDLSASMNLTGDFDHPTFKAAMKSIIAIAIKNKVPCGMHIVNPIPNELEINLKNGYRFIAYSIDAVFLRKAIEIPLIQN